MFFCVWNKLSKICKYHFILISSFKVQTIFLWCISDTYEMRINTKDADCACKVLAAYRSNCAILIWSDIDIFLIIYFTHKKVCNKLAFSHIWMVQMRSYRNKTFHICSSMSTCVKWPAKLCHFNMKWYSYIFHNLFHRQKSKEQVMF